MIDRDFRVKYVNRSGAGVLGTGPEEVTGKPLDELFPPDTVVRMKEGLLEVFKSGKPFSAEMTHSFFSGDFSIHVSLNPIFDDDGRVGSVMGISRDIDDLKRAERALRESEEQYRFLVENSKDITWKIDLQGNFTFVSGNVEKLTGRRADEVVGTTIWDLLAPECHDLVRDKLRRRELGEELLPYEVLVLGRDGNKVPFEISTAAFLDDGGKVVGVQGVSRDITLRKQAEKALRKSEERYRMLVESAPLGILTCDLQGNITSINAKVLELMGSPSPEFTRSVNLLSFEPLVRSGLSDSIRRCLFDGEGVVAEGGYTSYWGKSVYLRFHLTPLRDGAGKVFCMLGVIEDITERKRAEEELRNSEAKFRALFENAGAAIFVADLATGGIIDCNAKAESLIGRPRGEIIGLHQTQLHPPDMAAKCCEMFAHYANNDGEKNFETLVQHRDGRTIPVMINAAPLKVNGREMMMGFFLDITERKRAELALAESEEKFRVLTETTPVAISILQDGKFQYINPAMEEISGYSRKELSSIDFIDLVHPDDRMFVQEQYHHFAKANPATSRYVFKGVRKDGEERWIDLYGNTIDFRGRPARLLTGTDITERKRVEEALRESEERFRRMAESIDEVFFIVTPDWRRAIYVSPAYEKIFGLKVDDLYRNSQVWLGAIVPEDRTVIEDMIARQARGEIASHITVEFRIVKPDESIRWIHASTYPILDEKGNIQMITGTARDITMRKQAEDTLKRNQFILAKSQETARLGNWAWDVRTDELSGSEENWRIVGLSPREIQPTMQLYQLLVHPDDREYIARHTESVLREGQKCSCDYRIIRLDGSIVYVNTIVDEVVRDEKGEIRQVYGINQDITERKKIEESLANAKSQAELYLDLMGHDINNMNMIAAGFLEMARNAVVNEGRLGPDTIDMLGTAMAAINNSSTLIRNVRKLQLGRSGEYRPEAYDLGAVIEEVAGRYASVPDRHVRISCGMKNGVKVQANELLMDVFINLIDNAIKHTSGPVFINIGMAAPEQRDGRWYCAVCVEDNGPGIPDGMKEQIFDRLRPGKTKVKGSGLGLYLVRTLLDSYGGKVWVEDRVKGDHTKGARFVVMLPVAQEKSEAG